MNPNNVLLIVLLALAVFALTLAQDRAQEIGNGQLVLAKSSINSNGTSGGRNLQTSKPSPSQPQSKFLSCVHREHAKLQAMDPSAPANFIRATAIHLCGG